MALAGIGEGACGGCGYGEGDEGGTTTGFDWLPFTSGACVSSFTPSLSRAATVVIVSSSRALLSGTTVAAAAAVSIALAAATKIVITRERTTRHD